MIVAVGIKSNPDIEALPLRSIEELAGLFPLNAESTGFNRYNLSPVINQLSNLPGFRSFNYLQAESSYQGILQCIFELQQFCCRISGFDSISLAPLSNKQAVYACLSMIHRYHQRNRQSRNTLLLSEASPVIEGNARRMGLVINIVALNQMTEKLDSDVAAIVLPLPSIEHHEDYPVDLITAAHEQGSIVYTDGYGQYVLPMKKSVSEWGVDVFSMDLAHLCSTGAGPSAVLANDALRPYLPVPQVAQDEGLYQWQTQKHNPMSIGPLSTAPGNIEALLRCYAWMRLQGLNGVGRLAMKSVLSAKYLMKKLALAGMTDACKSTDASGVFSIHLDNTQASRQAVTGFLRHIRNLPIQADSDENEGASSVIVYLSQLQLLKQKQLDELSQKIVDDLR